jgi:hypothetical protein
MEANDLAATVRVFGTHHELVYDGKGYTPAAMVTDHTQAVINKMTAMRIEQAVRDHVYNSVLAEMADRLNQVGRGLLADRMDLAADGVSHLALMGWRGNMRFARRPTRQEIIDEASVINRDLWNGDEGNDNVSMH